MPRLSYVALALVFSAAAMDAQTVLPTGKTVTPDAAPGSVFQPLNPQLAALPDLNAGQAVAASIGPDGATMLVLTSGYNKFYSNTGTILPNEYVFVYDISQGAPTLSQVLQIPNTFNGIAWNPNGAEFYVSGGPGDSVYVFGKQSGGGWGQAAVVPLGHKAGIGLSVGPIVAGVAVNGKGSLLVTANFENDSVTVIDPQARKVTAEIDLRPGVANAAMAGVPGGEYPFWVVVKGDTKAYISSLRDREIVIVDLSTNAVTGRIPVPGQPNKMVLDKAQSLLYATLDNSDSVAVIDTASDTVSETFETISPQYVWPASSHPRGANPNGLALSPDEATLYVTNGGANSLAVIQLRQSPAGMSQVVGLIPTGWYPNAVAVSKDGSTLYVVNGKSVPGPDPRGGVTQYNQYVWQLTHAGLLTIPVPNTNDLMTLTAQVATNNNFPGQADFSQSEQTMAALRQNIQHVVYIVKENRTYDQILGDLEIGNGDPSLAIYPGPVTPNQHQLARQFVTLDNFLDTAEVSGNGWNWSTAARASDFVEKTVPLNYAGRGGPYDWEGYNRNVNPALPTLAARRANNSAYPNDPNLLPGAADVSAPDASTGEAGAGYLWDAALRGGLTVRNYGFFVANQGSISTQPYADGIVQVTPNKQALADITDLYYRGFDQNNADYYLFREWEREFDAYASANNLPNLMLVRLPHDHTGSFATARYGVNTAETQTADNDYAVGLFAQKIAASPYASSTLLCVLEDDAQDGADHMDAHRSVAFLAGPYVRQGALITKRYTTVNMLRTIEAVLGIEAMNFYDGLSEPMADAFDPGQTGWSYQAIVPEVLRTTKLPLPARTAANSLPLTKYVRAHSKPRHNSAWWEKKMGDQDFEEEDRLETDRFNQVLWEGLMGKRPYPAVRDGKDLRQNREELLQDRR